MVQNLTLAEYLSSPIGRLVLVGVSRARDSGGMGAVGAAISRDRISIDRGVRVPGAYQFGVLPVDVVLDVLLVGGAVGAVGAGEGTVPGVGAQVLAEVVFVVHAALAERTHVHLLAALVHLQTRFLHGVSGNLFASVSVC